MTEFEELNAFKKILIKVFGKNFDELSLYVMSASSLLIYLIDSSFRSDFHNYLRTTDDLRVFLILIYMLIGLSYSIFHAFSKKYKRKSHKSAMLYFALTLQAFVAFTAFYLSMENDSIPITYPLINLLAAYITYLLYDSNLINENNIIDRDARLIEVLLASLITSSVISITILLLHLHWIEALSISIILGNHISSITHKASSIIILSKS